MKLFIIRSGDGYFLEFADGSLPHLTSDPVEAARLKPGRANNVKERFEKEGFTAELVEVDLVPLTEEIR